MLLVAPQPFFEVRGTPLNVLQMVRTLCDAGLHVELVTYALGTPVNVPGLVHHRAMALPGVRAVPPGFSWRKVASDVPLAFMVLRLLATRRYDVVHAVEEAIFFTLPMAKARGLPVIYDLDSCISEQLREAGKVRSPMALRVIEAVERATLRRASLALTVCPALTDLVRAAAPNIPVAQVEDAPLEEMLVEPTATRVSELRERYGLAGAAVAVYAGNFESYQGVDLLLDAVPRLAGLVPHARLLIVGGEPSQIVDAQHALEQRGVADRVIFAGKQPPATLAAHLALGAALVSPRRRGTNVPLKLYSYMHAGVPIVATDLSVHRQVLDDQTAVLCAPEADALAEALATVLAAPEAHRALGERARARVERDYSIGAFRRKLLDAYASVLGSDAFTSSASNI